MPVQIELGGRHAVVTGGSRGIGRGLAVGLAQAGARVTIIARDKDKIADAIAELGPAAGHGGICADLTDEADAARAIKEAAERAGAPAIVVNNLGGTMGIRELTAPVSDWIKVWRLNLGSAIAVNNAAIPAMKALGWGRLIHITSPAAEDGNASGPYVAAKAALNGYIRTLGRELAPAGVIVSGLSFGAIAAYGNVWDVRARENPAFVADMLRNHQAIGRLGNPEDVASFVTLLASDRGGFASGCIIPVHGGWK